MNDQTLLSSQNATDTRSTVQESITRSNATSVKAHPILIPNGYQINTRPTERFANFVRRNISEGFHGCSGWAGGGVGKTSAIIYLTENASRWLLDRDRKVMAVAMRMVMASGIRRSDRAFWASLNDRMGMGASRGMTSAVGMNKVRNLINSRCGQAGVNRLVLFIDNAQRITEAEYEYLEDLDSRILEDGLHLFLVLMRQSDAEGVDVGDDWRDRGSHSIRRWFMATTPFGPLLGIDEVTHALRAYDISAWPTPETPYSRFFARRAFDNGWRLNGEAALIWEVVNDIRKKGKLPESESWPMATFTLMVRHLLYEIAFREEDFSRFTADHVVTALRSSGYLRLEYVRSRMRIPSGN